MRYLLTISYDGQAYSGWQKQKNSISIQEVLSNAIETVLGHEVNLFASGRTDAGVSALKQTVHFETNELLSEKTFVNRVNHLLNDDIKILSLKIVNDNFHARFDVKKKTYAYNFYLSKTNIPYLDRIAVNFKQNVDLEIFKCELKKIEGTHDFTSFCASDSSVENKVRTIYKTQLIQNGDLYTVLITGNGFLYNMVRIIIGTLIDIASGKLKENDILQIISYKDRTRAGFTAKAKGLVLVNVEY